MVWSLSFQLVPGENVLEDSVRNDNHGNIKPAYSITLTDKRALFRFNGFGSSLTQTFPYDEVLDVKPCKRFFVSYLIVKTPKKDYLLNVADPVYWARRIREQKEKAPKRAVVEAAAARPAPARKKRELLDMLTVLRRNDLLTEAELEEKIQLLERIQV